MVKSKDDPRLRFIVTMVVILGAIILALVAILVLSEQADQLAQVILATGFLLCSVLAIALGYNVLARFRDTDGRSGELNATAPKDV